MRSINIKEIHLVNIEDIATKIIRDLLDNSMLKNKGPIKRLTANTIETTMSDYNSVNVSFTSFTDEENFKDDDDAALIDSCDRCRQRVKKRFLFQSKSDNKKYCLGCKIRLNEDTAESKNSSRPQAFREIIKSDQESIKSERKYKYFNTQFKIDFTVAS
jgi:hypothetical protein